MFGRQLLCILLAIPLGLTTGFASAQKPKDPQPLVVTVGGEPFPGRLIGIDNDRKFLFSSDNAHRKLAATDLVRWGNRQDWRKGRIVLLDDGSHLTVKRLNISDQKLAIYSGPFDGASIPLTRIRGIVFRPPLDALARDRLLEKIASTKRGKDQLLLENGDVVRGTFFEKPTGQQTAQQMFDKGLRQLHLRTDSGPVRVPVERIIALTFAPAVNGKVVTRDRTISIGFRDGSLLQTKHVAKENDRLKFTLIGSVSLTTESTLSEIWDEIVFVQPTSPRVTYLSDIKPLSYKHIPFLEMTWPYGTDRNARKGSLRAGDQVYSKGIGMHSSSRLAYDLGGKYHKFQADLSIDSLAGRRGSVVFRIYLAKTNKWELAYESPIVRGSERPLPISVDVSGARRMALIVEKADHGDEWDHANWLGARLVK